MRKFILIILILCILFNTTGCKVKFGGMEEIDELLFVRIAGIDRKPGNDNIVRITISSKRVKPSGNNDNKAEKAYAETLSAEGSTIFEAVRNLHTFSDMHPFWGHMDFILIGEDAAKDDILKYMDFFARESQFRLTARVIVVSGGTAEEVILKAATGEDFISDRLNHIFDKIGETSISVKVSLAKLLELFGGKSSSAYLPGIRMKDSIGEEIEEKAKNDIVLDRIAVFKEGKLLDYIKGDEAKGFNWITGQVNSGIIVVKDETGNKNSLEILESDTKIIPKFNSKDLSVTIKIRMSSNVGEQQSGEDIYNEKSIGFLEKQQNELIASQVKSALRYAQQSRVDIFGIGDSVFHKHPVKWAAIKDQWVDIFSRLDFNVLVESKINRTYEIREPAKSLDGEK